MQVVYDDGGRAAAGFKGSAGDCVVRSISIATQLPYIQVYDALNTLAKLERKRMTAISSSRNGVRKDTARKYLQSIGWKWVSKMFVGQGCKTHLRDGELPMGRLIVSVSKHAVAVIDGVIHDTYNPSRGGTRCVYGYFIKE